MIKPKQSCKPPPPSVVRGECKKNGIFWEFFPNGRPPPPFGNFEKILPFFLVKLKIFG